MSFSWKSLLSSGGGGGGQSSSNPANPSSSSNQENANQSIQDVLNSWELQPEGLPPLLGMDNFGNTCYVNSVLQALYFCRPFRESIMSYPSSQSQIVTPQVKGVSTAPNSPLSLNTKNLPMERTPADLTSTPQSINSPNSTTPHVAPSARGGRAAAVRPSTASSTSSPSVPLLKNNSKSKKDSENSESSGHKRRASLNAMAKGFSSARPPSSGGRSSGTAPKSPILTSTAADASFSTPSTTSASTSPSTVATSATSTSTLPPSSSSTANPQPKEQDTLFSTLRDLFHLIHDSASQPVATPTNATTTLSSQKSNGGRPATASGRLGGSNNTSSLSPSNSTTATASRPGSILADPPVGAGTPHASRGGKNVATGKVPSDSVRRFWSALKKENILFDSTMHQDAHEMLNFVLNKVGEDLIEEERERKKDLSFEENQVHNQNQKRVHQVESGGKTWVHRLFEGVLTNETRCLTCESVTSRDEAFLDLSIDIVQNSSVSSCLRQFSASEMLCSKNKFFCDTCSGLQEAEKRMKIKKLPNVLALHLKRFKYEEEVQRFVKLAYRVVFPFELRLFNTSDDAENPDRLYELFGIVIHVGVGYHHGHYITIVKVGGRWVVFDDTNVGFIEENDIARYFGDSPGSGSAYVLFYQAVDLDHESLGLAPPIPAYATAANPRFDAAVPQQVPSSPLESMAPDRVSSPAPMDIPSSKLQARNNIPIPVSAGSSTGLSSSSGSSGGGLFGRRQGSTSIAGLSGDERLDPEKLSSPSGGGGGGGWFGSFRGGNRERRATGSSSAAPASSSSEALYAPSSYRPISTTNPGSGSATGETDDGLSLSASSKTTDSTQADKFIGSDLASSPASSAPPLPLPPVSTEPSLPPADDLTPRPAAAQASTNVNGAEAEVLRTPTATFSDLPAMTDEPQQLPQESGSRNGVGIGNASEPPISGGGGGAQSRFVSAPVTSSPSQGMATGASFAPADRPLTRKEQEKIAKKSRRASAHSSSNFNPYSTSNLPPSPSVGNAGASDEGLGHFSPPTNTKRHSMRRAFGLKKKS